MLYRYALRHSSSTYHNQRLLFMKAQLDAIQARLSKVKAKKNHKRVKREPAPIQLDASGDIIDLTSD